MDANRTQWKWLYFFVLICFGKCDDFIEVAKLGISSTKSTNTFANINFNSWLADKRNYSIESIPEHKLPSQQANLLEIGETDIPTINSTSCSSADFELNEKCTLSCIFVHSETYSLKTWGWKYLANDKTLAAIVLNGAASTGVDTTSLELTSYYAGYYVCSAIYTYTDPTVDLTLENRFKINSEQEGVSIGEPCEVSEECAAIYSVCNMGACQCYYPDGAPISDGNVDVACFPGDVPKLSLDRKSAEISENVTATCTTRTSNMGQPALAFSIGDSDRTADSTSSTLDKPGVYSRTARLTFTVDEYMLPSVYVWCYYIDYEPPIRIYSQGKLLSIIPPNPPKINPTTCSAAEFKDSGKCTLLCTFVPSDTYSLETWTWYYYATDNTDVLVVLSGATTSIDKATTALELTNYNAGNYECSAKYIQESRITEYYTLTNSFKIDPAQTGIPIGEPCEVSEACTTFNSKCNEGACQCVYPAGLPRIDSHLFIVSCFLGDELKIDKTVAESNETVTATCITQSYFNGRPTLAFTLGDSDQSPTSTSSTHDTNGVYTTTAILTFTADPSMFPSIDIRCYYNDSDPSNRVYSPEKQLSIKQSPLVTTSDCQESDFEGGSSCTLSCAFAHDKEYVAAYSEWKYTTDAEYESIDINDYTFNEVDDLHENTTLELTKYNAGYYECFVYYNINKNTVNAHHSFKIEEEQGIINGENCTRSEQCVAYNSECVDKICQCVFPNIHPLTDGNATIGCLPNADPTTPKPTASTPKPTPGSSTKATFNEITTAILFVFLATFSWLS